MPPTCDCRKNPAEPAEPHEDDCIHWILQPDDPSDHYGQ